MNFLRYRFVTFLMISALLVGIGILKSTAADYFPLKVGNMWTYSPSYGSQGDRVDSIIDKEDVNGTLTYIWNRQEAPDDNYNEKRWLAKDDTYLRVYKIWANENWDQPLILIPSWQMLKLNPVVGDTWSFEFDIGSMHIKGTYDVESTTDSVTVAAGNFNNCIIVRSLVEATDGGVTEYEYKKFWYAPDVGPIIYREYTENWDSLHFNQELVSFTIWETIQGNVTYDGTPLCAMVLANGQYMFSCAGNGEYNMEVPLDPNGNITLFAFVDGLAPFKQTLTPAEAENFDIEMELASPDSQSPTVNRTVPEYVADPPGWVKISGSVYLDTTPLCAMVLANGQYMFSCGDKLDVGNYELVVPLDNGSITLFVFVDGLQPYKEIISKKDGLPFKPVNPIPADGVVDQSTNTSISWENGGLATSYDVYFGTNSTPSDFIGNQTTTVYDPGTLLNDTTYYWRIDAKNVSGTTTGDVWQFSTSKITMYENCCLFGVCSPLSTSNCQQSGGIPINEPCVPNPCR